MDGSNMIKVIVDIAVENIAKYESKSEIAAKAEFMVRVSTKIKQDYPLVDPTYVDQVLYQFLNSHFDQ